MKKSLIIKIAAAVVVVAVVATGIGLAVSGLNGPKKTIAKFEAAYNAASIDDMVACFEPSVQKMYSGVSGIFSSIIGMDMNDITDMICGVMPFLDGTDFDGDVYSLPKIDIKVKSVDIDGDYAKADVVIVLTQDSEVISEESGEIELCKVDGEWYLDASGLF